MVKAPFNLAHPAAAVTLARYYAKREVQWQWRAQGIKVHYIEPHDLALASEAYLNEHRAELIEQAKLTLASPRYRSFVESSATAQHRKPRKPRP
jgi:hypothetical protein